MCASADDAFASGNGYAYYYDHEAVSRAEEEVEVEEARVAEERRQEQARLNATFTHIGNRSFRCSCGGTDRVTKTEWKAYQAGEAVHVSCVACGGEAHVSMSESGNTASHAEKSTKDNSAADMAAKLANAWGAR